MTRTTRLFFAIIVLGSFAAGFLETDQEKTTNPDIEVTSKHWGVER